MPAATPGQTPNAVAVSNPSQFQEAVRQGVKHIVINDHLDMVGTPRFSETTIMDAGMIAISPNQNGEYTNSIRGNCSNPPPNLSLDPPRKPNQCIIQVREDFLESSVENSQVWVSNLYITLPGEEKNHTTLIGVHGGDVYLTDMTFVADGDKARAIDVKPNRRLYVAQSHFSQFSKDKDGVIRLEPGSKATLDTVTFQKNTVATGKADAVAAGPVMGLYAGIDGGGSLGAAAWFQNCRFGESTSAVPGDVSVESRSCRVYSNTKLPTVWDLDLQREVDAWPLAVRTSSSDASGAPVDVFADVSGESGPFLRPNDGFFSRVVQQQAKDTGMEPVVITPLPDGNEFVTADPYAGDDGFWTDQNIGLIVGLCGGAVILSLITLAVAAWYFRFRKSSDVDKTDAKSLGPTGTEAESAVPALHHPNWSANQFIGTPSLTAANSSVESGLNPVHVYGAPGQPGQLAHAPSSQGSMPHGPYHGQPYGMPAGGNYGGPNYVGSYAGSQYVAPSHGPGSHGTGSQPAESHAAGSHAGGYAGGQSYGAASFSESDYPGSEPGVQRGYGAAAYGGAAFSGPKAAGIPEDPSMYGSIPDSASGMQPGVPYAGVPQPEAVGTGSAARALQVQHASASGMNEEDGDSMLGGLPGLASGATAVPESRPRLDADGRVIVSSSEGAPVSKTASSLAAPATAGAAQLEQAPQKPGPTPALGVAHTARFIDDSDPQPAPGVDLYARGDTQDAAFGPFAASAASAATYRGGAAAGAETGVVSAKSIEDAGHGGSKVSDAVRAKRSPLDLAATQVFDKTVAPDTDIADFTHEKVVDMLEDVHAEKALFQDKYELMGSVHQRLSGTGIVQYAKATDSNATGDREVALKFYIKRAAFDRVASMFSNPQVKPAMSAIHEVVSNNSGKATASCVLPPAIVMKRGEPLEEWALRLHPNLPTALNALCGIAELLKDLHACGYIYYAMKPTNVAWFSDEKKWKLIDFACAARKGMRTGLSFSLNYAAPEIIIAQESGQRTLEVSPAADIWALGVVAFELLSSTRTFAPGTPTLEIRNMISGRLPLPWEEQEPKQLRTLRHSVLSCLSRNAADRPSAAEIHSAWKNLLDFAAVKHTEVAA